MIVKRLHENHSKPFFFYLEFSLQGRPSQAFSPTELGSLHYTATKTILGF